MIYDIVPAGDAHAGFIKRTFLGAVREGWPWRCITQRDLWDDFQRRRKRPGVRVAVAVMNGDPDEFLGWAAVEPLKNEILFAYTLADYRSRDGYKLRVGTTLVSTLGVDLGRATALRYWTPAAEELSKRSGYNLEPTKETR